MQSKYSKSCTNFENYLTIVERFNNKNSVCFIDLKLLPI